MSGRYSVVVPARLASTRLPEKLLLAETGKPLIVHTLENLAPLRAEADLWLVTDSERIAEAGRGAADRVFVSRREHASGTSRIAELLGELRTEWILNVQGDEPEIETGSLSALMRVTAASGAPMGTLGAPLADEAAWRNPNAVKVLVSRGGRAVYFSRAPLPHGGGHATTGVLLHLGVYAYRRDLLARWHAMPAGELEARERLEQLRALENDVPILVLPVPAAGKGIDAREDYEAFKRRRSGRA